MSPTARRRIGIAEVEALSGRERKTIWRWVKAAKFPAPHYIGNRRLWWADEVEAALAALAKPAVSAELLENLQGAA